MDIKSVAIAIAITAVVSAAVTRYYFPKLQMQTVEVEKEVVKNNVVTVIKTVKEKDGTEETTTTIVDKTEKKQTDSKTVTVAAKNDWVISASVGTKFDDLKPIYGAQVQRRILGPFYLGAMANTDKTIGLSIGFEF